MIFWAIAAQTFLLLSIITLFTEKDATGLSLAAYILLSVSAVVWIFYAAAVLRPLNKVIIVSSSLGLVLSIVMIGGIAAYRESPERLPEPTSPA